MCQQRRIKLTKTASRGIEGFIGRIERDLWTWTNSKWLTTEDALELSKSDRMTPSLKPCPVFLCLDFRLQPL